MKATPRVGKIALLGKVAYPELRLNSTKKPKQKSVFFVILKLHSQVDDLCLM
ncbi:hypothetical protein PAUR_a2605 [Pseudoalteromonas aurantia 208]|uniref:Uncharacterized protein n=1 Tax=Pseudoalteromonas aurantia 208 TaxID=1314867 RepID=A0ABR9EEQ7_9GAMM|nr:hypothetical protein [Pseudoalteromonas aurantia 208]